MSRSLQPRIARPGRTHTVDPRRVRAGRHTCLRLEQLEERTLLTVNPGMMLVGPSLPTDPATGLPLNMLWGQTQANGSITDQPQLGDTGFATGVYQAPGSNALSTPPYNINQPYIVNGSPSFNQAAE
jgi:hypothetical protein